MSTVTHLRRNNVLISVHVDGQPLPFYMRLDGMPFIEGIPGKPYVLLVENMNYRRIEIITSVDGRNTLKEEPADWAINSGMIVNSRQVWKNRGWRLNDSEVAEFKFADPEASVAAAAGAPKNIGVIGFAIFHERGHTQPISDSFSDYSKSSRGLLGGGMKGGGDLSFNSGGRHIEERTSGGLRGMSVNSADIGTGAGETRHDAVGRTEWTRNSFSPVEVITIQYRTRETLDRMGLLVSDPQAFSNKPDDTGYGKLLGR